MQESPDHADPLHVQFEEDTGNCESVKHMPSPGFSCKLYMRGVINDGVQEMKKYGLTLAAAAPNCV